MEGAILGAAVSIILAVVASTWRLSGQIRSVVSKVDAMAERLDRVNVEELRDRVTKLEVRAENAAEACKGRHA